MYCHLRPPDTTAFPIQHLSRLRIWAADKSFASRSLDNTGDLRTFQRPCPIVYVSRFVQKIFVIKCRSRRKTEQMLKFIGPIFSWGATPTVLQQIVSAIYHPPFGKVWLSSVCWSPSAKHGSDVESRIYIGRVTMAVQFEAVCGPKFMSFRDNVADPGSCQRTWPIVYIVFRSKDIGR